MRLGLGQRLGVSQPCGVVRLSQLRQAGWLREGFRPPLRYPTNKAIPKEKHERRHSEQSQHDPGPEDAAHKADHSQRADGKERGGLTLPVHHSNEGLIGLLDKSSAHFQLMNETLSVKRARLRRLQADAEDTKEADSDDASKAPDCQGV